MQKQNSGLFVMLGRGTHLLRYSFDEERDEVTVTCPGCLCSYIASARPGAVTKTLEHEADCQVLTRIESLSE